MFSSLRKSKPVDKPVASIEYIGRFELIRELGKGAQGIVYLAKDLKLNREVAVKTLLHKSKDSDQIINEARNVSALQHPNIIPLYEIGMHEQRPFLVYPYVQGKTLRDYLNKNEKLTVIEATKIISAVLDGLAHAHEKGIIHRDLNPSNILLDENDNPRIMDFGISTFAGHNTSDTDIVGTINYMAPEQLNNSPTGPWSDVFSVGVMLFEMLTGHCLFKAKNSMVSIYKILNDNILPPSSRNKVIDKELDRIVLKALSKDKESRFKNASEMKDALDHYNDEETREITVVPVSTDQQAAKEQATLMMLKRSMSKNSEFPVMGNSIAGIMQLTDGQGCAEKMAEIILRDQSLSGKILSLVNSSSYGQFGGEIKTISRAVVILGLTQVQSLSISIMVFEKLNNGPMAETLKSNACQSFLSAIFAKNLTKKSKTINPEEAFLASMFHNLGRQITIYFLPDEYNDILNLVIDKGINEDMASKRILGLNFASIGQYIASEWQLPENIIQGIQPKPYKITQRPTASKDYLAQLAALTNEIVEAAACGNNEKAEKELKKIIHRYKISFSLTYEKLTQILEYLFKELINYCEVLGINQNKNTFCRNFISFSNHDYNFEDDGEYEETAANSENRKGFHESILTYGIAKITGMLFKQYELNDLFNVFVNTIHRGLDCEHVIVFLKDPVNGEMKAQYGAGKDMTTVFKRFHFHSNNDDDIFNQSMKDQKDLFIPEVAHSALLNKIPDWCKKTTLPKNLLLFPIISNKACIGLLYIDNARVLSTKSRQAFDYIDILRRQAAVALKQKQ